MALKPDPVPPIPEETAGIARAAFPRGNVSMQIRDALGTLVTDESFRDLLPTQGQPAASPWRLALVTVMPFMENLTDRRLPKGTDERLQLANRIGADGWTLLHLVADEAAPQWLRELPALPYLDAAICTPGIGRRMDSGASDVSHSFPV